jgi:hypothetical protein
MRLARWVLLVLGAVSGGCGSGQTGSADCARPTTCACQLLANQIVARAHFIDVDGEARTGTVELDEVLNETPLGANPSPGFRVSGSFLPFVVELAKTTSACEAVLVAPPVVDQPVLVTFSRDAYARLGCTNCPDGCDAGCVEALDPPPLEAEFWTLPWESSYDFAGTPVSPAEMSTLSNVSECEGRFPAAPVACNDTVTIEQGPFGCSVSTAPRRAPLPWVGLAALGGVLVLRGARRRSRRERGAA